MDNGWTERLEGLEKLVEELTEKLKATEEEMLFWRRESRLSDAGLNMAEDKIRELEAERDADRRREYGYSQQTVDALTLERDRLTAENKRLRELVDGAREVVEVFQFYTPAGEAWRDEWLAKAQQALKEASHGGLNERSNC